jgi:hypothetical protein
VLKPNDYQYIPRGGERSIEFIIFYETDEPYSEVSLDLSLDQREILQNVISIESEKMVYYFCCEDRKHFPVNFDRTDNFILKDWMAEQEIPISREEFRILS